MEAIALVLAALVLGFAAGCRRGRRRVAAPPAETTAPPEGAAAAAGELEAEVTALRAENEALGRLSRVQGELMAVASHELKTPLTSISAYTDVLLQRAGAGSFPQTAEFLGVVKAETERLLRMTDRILDLSRLEIGGRLLQRQVVELGPLLRETGRAMAPLFARKRMSLQVDCPAGLPRVEIDPDLIRQALINLVNNALKYTPAGGAVRVWAVEDAATVKVCVSDDGPGIPAEELGRIFRQFYRLESAAGEEGSGLGLAIVKSILALHDGHVDVESHPGQGATFSLYLPKEQHGECGPTLLLGARPADPAVQRLLKLCARTAAELAEVRRAAVLLLDAEGRPLAVAALGAATDDGQGVAAAALAGRSEVAAPPAEARSWEAAVPLKVGERCLGALVAAGRLDAQPLDLDDLALLGALAEVFGTALAAAEPGEGNGRRLGAVVEALQAVSRLRRSDVPTATPLALRLLAHTARRLGLSRADSRRLQYVASLHDAGMVVLGDEIVRKGGALSPDEREQIERHPEEGARLVAPLLSRPDLERIIAAHHERMDGGGYPAGLPGGEIPLGARILAVVDAFFAMIRRRPYRQPLPPERVEAEIRRHSGTQFDPQVVDAFLAVLREEGILQPAEAAAPPASAATPPREPAGAGAGSGANGASQER